MATDKELISIQGAPIEPMKYNIVLLKDGQKMEFDFAPAPMDKITHFGFVLPHDPCAVARLVLSDEDLYSALGAVIGKTYRGELGYHTRKQTIISLHDTAILGYQRQSIIDPRISNDVALFWEIYLDQRIFVSSEDIAWQETMAQIIISELADPQADAHLADDIKNRLLEDTDAVKKSPKQ